jgi:hypothetical protein
MLFENVHDESVTLLGHYYGDDFVIDETTWHGQTTDGKPFLCDGKSGPVSFRLLHVFEVKDGKITREQARVRPDGDPAAAGNAAHRDAGDGHREVAAASG